MYTVQVKHPCSNVTKPDPPSKTTIGTTDATTDPTTIGTTDPTTVPIAVPTTCGSGKFMTISQNVMLNRNCLGGGDSKFSL